MKGRKTLAIASAMALMMSCLAPGMVSFADEASYKVKVENVPGGYLRVSYWKAFDDSHNAIVYLPVGETSEVPAGTELRIQATNGYWTGLRTTDRKVLVNGEELTYDYRSLTVDEDLTLSAEFEQEEYDTSSSDDSEENDTSYKELEFKSTESTDIYKATLDNSLDEALVVYDDDTDKTTSYTESPEITSVYYSNDDIDDRLEGDDIPFVIDNGHLKIKEGATLPDGKYNYEIQVNTESSIEGWLYINMYYFVSARTPIVTSNNGNKYVSYVDDAAVGTNKVSDYYNGTQLQIANHAFESASFDSGSLKGQALGDQTVAAAAGNIGYTTLNVKFKNFTPALLLPTKNLSDAFYEKQSLPFKDVSDSSWSAKYIKYAYYNGLMTGKSDTKFDPTGNFTRAQAVVVLYAAAGKPDVEITSKFSDLSADWYKKAVSWAVENGITGGTGDGSTFSPDAKVTKEQLALFLMKYAELCHKDTSGRKDVSGFADAGKIDGWAKDAVEWAVEAGVITGDGTNIQPQGSADRQTAATMFRTAMKNVLLA
jgi:hypothetical protein